MNKAQNNRNCIWKIICLVFSMLFLSIFFVLEKITIRARKVAWIENKDTFNLNAYSSQNHAPTLNTICDILSFVEKNSGLYSKTDLWKSLPKQIMYQTYKVIVEYLISSELIEIQNRRVNFSSFCLSSYKINGGGGR